MKKLLLGFCAIVSITYCPESWDPNFYSMFKGATPQMYHALKAVPRLKFKGNESVLDVGCGDGKISAYIAQNLLPYGTMLGIDNSEAMINAAQKITVKNASFNCISLFDYQPTKLYDTVLSFWVLYLFDDYQKALQKVISFLKPGGKALICHIIEPGTTCFQLFKKAIAPIQVPITLPSLKTITKALEEAPVTIKHIEVTYTDDEYPNFESFVTSMKNIPFFKLLPEEQEAQFFDQLSSFYPEQKNRTVIDSSLVIYLVLEKNYE